MKQYYATISPSLLLTALLEYIRYCEGFNETILCYNSPSLSLTALLEYIRYSEGCNETIFCYN